MVYQGLLRVLRQGASHVWWSCMFWPVSAGVLRLAFAAPLWSDGLPRGIHHRFSLRLFRDLTREDLGGALVGGHNENDRH